MNIALPLQQYQGGGHRYGPHRLARSDVEDVGMQGSAGLSFHSGSALTRRFEPRCTMT